MTIEEFDKHAFMAEDKVKYRYDDVVYSVVAVDFVERLIGVRMHISGGDAYDIKWLRCENVDLV